MAVKAWRAESKGLTEAGRGLTATRTRHPSSAGNAESHASGCSRRAESSRSRTFVPTTCRCQRSEADGQRRVETERAEAKGVKDGAAKEAVLPSKAAGMRLLHRF